MEWPDLIVEELIRCGVSCFYIAPGSRSTPLVSAIARNKNTTRFVHYDERGTAFAALGYARASGRAAAWITTSGTAVANGLPAVVEASADSIPMILLTADRPPELRDTGANQTIKQSDLFGEFVRWKFEFPVSDQMIDPAFVLTTVDQAVYQAVARKGPVHLNCMFRKPLESKRIELESELPAHLTNWMKSDRPYTHYVPYALRAPEAAIRSLRSLLDASRQPVVVLGRELDSSYEKAVVSWASKNHLPVLPDISSPFRFQPPDPVVIPYWDLLLSMHEFRDNLQPDLIIQFGRGTVSTHFEGCSVKRVTIGSGPNRFDSAHRLDLRIEADSHSVTDLVAALSGAGPDTNLWLETWQSKNDAIAATINEYWARDGRFLTEQATSHVLSSSLDSGSTIVIGNSLSVRHMNRFASAGDDAVLPILNRGASGIDGTIAVASGAATALSSAVATSSTSESASAVASLNRVVVLLGDQALLHDLNSLAMAKDSGLIIVVVNNRGGRIFHHLPVSNHEDIFEKYFVRSHDYSFDHAAAMFDLKYTTADTLQSFHECFRNSLKSKDATLIEIQIDFEESEVHHRKMMDSISRALSGKPLKTKGDSTGRAGST